MNLFGERGVNEQFAPRNQAIAMGHGRPEPEPLMRASGLRSASMQRSLAGVAQLAEQPSCKRQVSGSNPLTGS